MQSGFLNYKISMAVRALVQWYNTSLDLLKTRLKFKSLGTQQRAMTCITVDVLTRQTLELSSGAAKDI